MGTLRDLYPMPDIDKNWSVPQQFDATFDFEYDEGRTTLMHLYQKGKDMQWDAVSRIDWDLELDYENPMQLPDEGIALHGSPMWDKMTKKERVEFRRHAQSWNISQFMQGEQAALICAAKIVESVPDLNAKFYAATQVMDEARHVAFGRLSLREYYPHLSQAERDEREEFLVEACYHMRDRFQMREVYEVMGLPVEECIAWAEQSEMNKLFKTLLFQRIVPVVKDIGLWGPKIQAAYADMGVLHYADQDLDELARQDEAVAADLDRRSGKDVRTAYVEAVAGAAE